MASFGSIILNLLIDEGKGVAEAVYGGLIGSWPGQTFVGLYVVVIGYMVLMGRAGEKSKEWGISALLLLVIGGVSSSYGAFSEWLGSPIWDTAQAAGGLAATGGDTSPGALSGILDANEDTLGKVMTTIDRVNVPGNFITDFWIYLKAGAVLFLLTLLACAQYLATCALLSIAIFSLLMMLMVGGIPLWLASFKESRFVFWAWLRQTLNYALWVFFLGAVSGIGNKFLSKAAYALEAWDLENDGVFTEEVGGTMLLCSLSIYMLLKATDWAAALTGGSSTNTGVVGAMGGVAGGAIGSGINALGGPAGSAAKWAAGAAGGAAMRGAGAAASLGLRAYSAMKGLGKSK